MNEIERAIDAIEAAFENSKHLGGWDFHEVRHEPLVTAIEALREQAEREKGCVFCNDERHRYALSVDTSRDAAIFNIFYCPMCGRRLEVKP